MSKKWLYILISLWIVQLASGYLVQQPLLHAHHTLSYYLFDVHPPAKNAALGIKPGPHYLSADSTHRSIKFKQRGKLLINNSRYDEFTPALIRIGLSGIYHRAVALQSVFCPSGRWSLPTYYAHLFRLTPF